MEDFADTDLQYLSSWVYGLLHIIPLNPSKIKFNRIFIPGFCDYIGRLISTYKHVAQFLVILLYPSKYFLVLQTFDRNVLQRLENDGYENHL